MKTTKVDRDDAVTKLRELLAPGDTVHTVLRHVAQSGMSRAIDCYKLDGGESRWLSPLVAKVTGFRFSDKREALMVGGCGMDMGFHVVSTLSRVLYPEGFGCIGKGDGYKTSCPSNDHFNGDRDYTPDPGDNPPADWVECGGCSCYHPPKFGGDCRDDANRWPGRDHWHKAGDDALRHRWL